MPKNRVLLSLIAIPLIALLVACGGGSKDKSSSSDSSGSNGSSSSDSSGSGSNSSSNDSSSSSDDISLENCKQFTNLAALATAAFGGSGSSAKFDKKAMDALVKATPKEIRADMQVMADTFVAYFDALAKIGVDLNDPQAFSKLDATKIQQLQDATSKLDTPKFTAAADKVDAYFTAHCS